MLIRYFVRTTGERSLDESYNQIDYKLLIDKEHKPVESFIKQLELISEYDSILLEDDLILCKDFKKRIEEVIKQYPNKIINFFTKPKEFFATREDSYFVYNQCTYYPKGLATQISLEMKQVRGYKPYDLVENTALNNLGISHIQYRPCLVQHLDTDTLIQYKTFNNRRSIYFIDYLDELNIPYEEAYLHKKELTELMNSKFK